TKFGKSKASAHAQYRQQRHRTRVTSDSRRGRRSAGQPSGAFLVNGGNQGSTLHAIFRLEEGQVLTAEMASPEEPAAASFRTSPSGDRLPNGLTYQASQSGLRVTVHENPLSTVLEYRRTPSPVAQYQDNRADAVVSLPILSGRELAALSSKKPSRDESCHSPGGHRASQVKLPSSRTRQRARDLSFLGFVTLLGAVCCVLGYLAFLRPQLATPVAINESAAKICLTPECVKTGSDGRSLSQRQAADGSRALGLNSYVPPYYGPQRALRGAPANQVPRTRHVARRPALAVTLRDVT
ncbi:hypothetical protein HPB47_021894, partial [Ixodes persulcatus]